MSTTTLDKAAASKLMAEFESKVLGHPVLKQVRSAVLEQIYAPSGQEITAVVGPTGVGKTTLSNNIEREILLEEQDRMRAQVRQQIAFYASTRTYRVVLDTHGWGAVADRLNEKAAKGDWAGMASEITDEMLEVYAVTGTWDDIGDKIKKRYQGLLDRVAFYNPYNPGVNEAEWRNLTRQFNG